MELRFISIVLLVFAIFTAESLAETPLGTTGVESNTGHNSLDESTKLEHKLRSAEHQLKQKDRKIESLMETITRLQATLVKHEGQKRDKVIQAYIKVPEKIKSYYKRSYEYKLQHIAELEKEIATLSTDLQKKNDSYTKRKIERLQVKLKVAKTALPLFDIGPPLKGLKVGDIGYALKQRMIQVVDGNNMLADILVAKHDETMAALELVWIEGYSTAGLNDYSRLKLPLMEVVGIKKYTTASNKVKTIHRLKPVPVDKYKVQLFKMFANLTKKDSSQQVVSK